MNNVDIRSLSFGDILYFCKMVEYNSVTKTAEHFHLTQSAISKKINSLETQLEMQLFIREKKRFKLTPAGRYLYEQWKFLPDKIGNDIQMGHVLQTGYQKNLVVAVLDSFSPEAFFLPIIRDFKKKYPGTQIRIETGAAQEIRKMLLESDVDVIFSVLYDFEHKEFEDVEWRLLGTSSHYVCMLNSNPLSEKTSLRMEDLKCSEFFCISPHVLPEYSKMIHELGEKAGFVPNIVKYVATAPSLTLNMIGNNEVYICDRFYRDFKDSNFRYLPLESTQSGYVMAWRKYHKKSVLKEFTNYVIKDYS